MDMTELKLRLMQQGAVFSKKAKGAMNRSRFGRFSFSDYATTSGVVMVLNNATYANVPVKVRGTSFTVEYENEKFCLYDGDRKIKVSVSIISAPKYALDIERLPDGTPVRELVMTHADRTRISPVHGCSYHCSFCTSNADYYKEVPIEQLEAALQIALSDPYNSPRHILISGGTPEADEDSYRWHNEVYRYFPKRYPLYEFDVMLSPRSLYPNKNRRGDDRDFLFFLKEGCGFDTMSVNLELYNEIWRNRFIPDKAALGRERYLHFIEDAVNIFGENKVRSSLVVGLEPMEDTLQGVRDIVSCGCIPVLSAFVPAPGTDMANYPAPDVDFLYNLVKKVDAVARAGGKIIGPLCRPCTHNSLTLEEGSFEEV